jgi:hypothetical protein
MKMRAIQIKLYSYEELSPESQKKAREDWEQVDRQAGSPMACEIVNENFKQMVGDAGYPTDNIQWSLSYCQGDGMAFYGREDVDSKMLERLIAEGWAAPQGIDTAKVQRLVEIEAFSLAVDITPNSFGGNYAHYNTMGIELEVYDHYVEGAISNDKLEAVRKSLEKFIEEDVRALSRKLAHHGYEVFDNYYEEEYIAEQLTCNDYEFTKDGSFWHHNSWVEKSNGQS